MKLLIVLCLGTLALSAPAPQNRNPIDFLYDDDETQASVRPVEVNTVEPKVTATKISDPRKPGQVVEQDEEEHGEADVQEKEPSPMASPLNLEMNESTDSEASAQVNETDNDDLENQNKSESSGSKDSAVTDTTIRVYDEDEVNGTTEKEERPEEEQEQEQEQEQDQEQAAMDDSYQYDDESFERVFQSGESPKYTTTAASEPDSGKQAINEDPIVDPNLGTQVVENGSYGVQSSTPAVTIPVKMENSEYGGLANWGVVNPSTVTTNDNGNVELDNGQLYNHGTLVIEKGTFEGQDMIHPFSSPFPTQQWTTSEKPEFPDWPYGPHGPPGFHGPYGPHGRRGQHGPPKFGGSHEDHPRFDGPPPPWVTGHPFHPHPFDHKSQEHKEYPFRDNAFHREGPEWKSRWGNPASVPLTSGSPTNEATVSPR